MTAARPRPRDAHVRGVIVSIARHEVGLDQIRLRASGLATHLTDATATRRMFATKLARSPPASLIDNAE